jgi:hypothetical protein
MLYLEQGDEGETTSVPLVPEDDNLASNKFYIWSQGVKEPVEFVVNPKNQVDLYIERNRFHKN